MSHMISRSQWGKQFPTCWLCDGAYSSATGNRVETHEIARGVHRSKAILEPAAWLRVCNHEDQSGTAIHNMRHLSLFTGSGIGTLAAKECGIETVAQCENDPACCYALERLWPNAKLFTDIHDVSVESLRSVLPIDIISGGFPCQDLSAGGRGAGIEGTRSGLWREMFRVIRQVRSRWILVENVPAIRLRGVDRVLAPLERIGYTCWPLVVGAWAVGAPHKRDRMWIVGRLAESEPTRLSSAGKTYERSGGSIDAAGTSQDLANPANDNWRGGVGGTEEGTGAIGRQRLTSGSAGELAQSTSERRQGTRPRDTGPFAAIATLARRTRWPSRPGSPQEEWERPRLIVESLGSEFDGFSSRIQRRANKAALRILGNAWCYQNALLMFSAIVEMEKQWDSPKV